MPQTSLHNYYTLHSNFQAEVLDFIAFLLEKQQKEALILPQKTPRTSHFGSAKGLIKMADDFNEPLEDFKEYM